MLNFNKIKKSLLWLGHLEEQDLEYILACYNDYSNQNIPPEIAKDFKYIGLSKIDFLTSDYLTTKGYKNLYEI